MTLEQQCETLLENYKLLLSLAREGLKKCGSCTGSGEIKWGLVTDKDREVVPCDSCGRPVLKKFLDENKIGV